MDELSREQADYFDKAGHQFPTTCLDDVSDVQKIEMEFLEKCLGVVETGTIVDFGCGNGRATFYFLAKGFNVIGVDVSQQSLEVLKNRYEAVKQVGWGKLTTQTGLPINQVDAIVGTDILHHIDLVHYLPKFKSSLKQGGKIVFSEPNAWHLPWYGYLLWKRIPWSIEKQIVHMNRTYLTAKFVEAGFLDVEVKGFGLIPPQILQMAPSLNRRNLDSWGNIKILEQLAYRLIVMASN